MSKFESVKRWLMAPKRPAEAQKKLPASDHNTIKCGLCNTQIQPSHLFWHWFTHTKVQHYIPVQREAMRSAPGMCYTVFIVRRPGYSGEHRRYFNLELLTAEYFGFAIMALRQEYPKMRFQNMLETVVATGGGLKMLTIVAESNLE